MDAAAVIPALDEEGAIGAVVRDLRQVRQPSGEPVLGEVVVADNGSRDATGNRAREAGATVVWAPRRGYGSACLAALRYLADRPQGPPEAVVFIDGDGSNDPAEVPLLLRPLEQEGFDLVIGARNALADPGSLTVPQRFGNRLATEIMNRVYGSSFSDLGPFRAVRWEALGRLDMADPDYGWTVEMQLKAAKLGLSVLEVDVRNLPRQAGRSKVAGTVRGVASAGAKILYTLWKHR
jgi:glycosyltransferase involved in cell wall biosynthesis